MAHIRSAWIGINVATTQNVQAMVMAIPRLAWDALVEMYGTDGSPIVPITAFDSELEMDCSICAVSVLNTPDSKRHIFEGG